MFNIRPRHCPTTWKNINVNTERTDEAFMLFVLSGRGTVRTERKESSARSPTNPKVEILKGTFAFLLYFTIFV
jgi:hypothetical protein